MSVRQRAQIQEVPRSAAELTVPDAGLAAANRRAILNLAAATCVMCLLLLGLSYFAVNHHLVLHRAGLSRVANLLAAHPLRWSALVTIIAIVLQVAIIRLIRKAPVTR